MNRIVLVLGTGLLVAAGGLSFAHLHEGDDHGGNDHGGNDHAGESVKVLASRNIHEKLDGHEATETVVEVALGPGLSGSPHRHPGPVFGYVLEGEYELGIDDAPAKIYKAGETFYEPTGCLHRVSKNPSATTTTRLIATVLHPRDAKNIVLPE